MKRAAEGESIAAALVPVPDQTPAVVADDGGRETAARAPRSTLNRRSRALEEWEGGSRATIVPLALSTGLR